MHDKMIYADNRKETVKLRMYSNRLIMSGWGIMLLGIWESVRATMSMYIYRREITDFMCEDLEITTHQERLVVFMVFVAAMTVAYFLGLLIHLYIGKSAISDGHGKKRRCFYLIPAIVIIMLSFMSQMSTEEPQQYETPQEIIVLDTAFATDLLDITLCLTCIEMIYCSARVHILRRKINRAVQ